MERIDRNGGRAAEVGPRPETMVAFDIHGAAHCVVRERPECRAERGMGRGAGRGTGRGAERPRAEPGPGLTPEVIRRWLAGLALALLGLGLLAEPGAATEPAAAPAVVLSSR
ncbi:hypothetical protein [Amaricoccus sp.]|uniref:hypothetical protein n=1 Tax=Amaricoccus sp. TaxID=1872485 RepID=UPI00260F2190|nr:hypothetical protein [Amaricoccus sp.]HRO12288.1 hypothetical protein [Amaricoccus sp.]